MTRPIRSARAVNVMPAVDEHLVEAADSPGAVPPPALRPVPRRRRGAEPRRGSLRRARAAATRCTNATKSPGSTVKAADGLALTGAVTTEVPSRCRRSATHDRVDQHQRGECSDVGHRAAGRTGRRVRILVSSRQRQTQPSRTTAVTSRLGTRASSRCWPTGRGSTMTTDPVEYGRRRPEVAGPRRGARVGGQALAQVSGAPRAQSSRAGTTVLGRGRPAATSSTEPWSARSRRGP